LGKRGAASWTIAFWGAHGIRGGDARRSAERARGAGDEVRGTTSKGDHVIARERAQNKRRNQEIGNDIFYTTGDEKEAKTRSQVKEFK